MNFFAALVLSVFSGFEPLPLTVKVRVPIGQVVCVQADNLSTLAGTVSCWKQDRPMISRKYILDAGEWEFTLFNPSTGKLITGHQTVLVQSAQ